MTNPALPSIETADNYCTALQIALPTGGELDRLNQALLDASNMLRDAIGQPLTPATSTIPLEINEFGFALIPLNPVTSVTQVVDSNGNTLPDDGTAYRVLGQRLNIYQRFYTYNALGNLDPVYQVTVMHGWDPMPGELLRWVRMLANSQVISATSGNLGMNGGVTSVAIDDGKVTFGSGPAIDIPDDARQRLRATYGGELA